jgi:hypothetical protein
LGIQRHRHRSFPRTVSAPGRFIIIIAITIIVQVQFSSPMSSSTCLRTDPAI